MSRCDWSFSSICQKSSTDNKSKLAQFCECDTGFPLSPSNHGSECWPTDDRVRHRHCASVGEVVGAPAARGATSGRIFWVKNHSKAC